MLQQQLHYFSYHGVFVVTACHNRPKKDPPDRSDSMPPKALALEAGYGLIIVTVS